MDLKGFNYGALFAEPDWDIQEFTKELHDSGFALSRILPPSMKINLHRSVTLQTLILSMNYKIAYHKFLSKFLTHLQAANLVDASFPVAKIDYEKELLDFNSPADPQLYDLLDKTLLDLQKLYPTVSKLNEFQFELLRSMLNSDVWSKCLELDFNIIEMLRVYMHQYKYNLNIHIFGYVGDELDVNTDLNSYVLYDLSWVYLEEEYENLIYKFIATEHLEYTVFPKMIYTAYGQVLLSYRSILIKEILMLNSIRNSAIQSGIPTDLSERGIILEVIKHLELMEA